MVGILRPLHPPLASARQLVTLKICLTIRSIVVQ